MTGSNAEDTGPLIIANIGSVANSGTPSDAALHGFTTATAFRLKPEATKPL
jgi:hypothetical protein